MSFIYISHRLDEIARIADRVVVMRDGRIVARHERADVPVRTVVEQMVGRSVDRMFPPLSTPGRRGRCSRSRTCPRRTAAFSDVSFSVQRRRDPRHRRADRRRPHRAGARHRRRRSDLVGHGPRRRQAGAPQRPGGAPSRPASCWCRRTARRRASCSTRRSARTSRSAISTTSRRTAGSGRAAVQKFAEAGIAQARRQGPARTSRSASCPAATSRRW